MGNVEALLECVRKQERGGWRADALDFCPVNCANWLNKYAHHSRLVLLIRHVMVMMHIRGKKGRSTLAAEEEKVTHRVESSGAP
jgi:hypothetical protein